MILYCISNSMSNYLVSEASGILGFIFRILEEVTDIYYLKSLYCTREFRLAV